jgi:hypothetical protein
MIDAINITRPRYSDIIDKVEVLAAKEERFPTNLAVRLIKEAIAVREGQQLQPDLSDDNKTE